MIKRKSILIGCLVILMLVACSTKDDKGKTDDTEINQVDNNDTESQNDNEKDNDGENDENTNEQTNNAPNDDKSNDEVNDSTEEDELPAEFDVEDKTIIALVNKENSLSEKDIPDDLVTVDVPTILDNPEVNQLRKVAADALKEMFDAAKKDDIHLYARSGYRSYTTQDQLFKNYAARNGEEAANRYSARPGQSEHQTGLVMDVTSASVNYQLTEKFDETAEGKWISENAHRFGFIIRYPKDKEHITGYIYEPWHLRYLGVDMATKVFESSLTYEEYLEEAGMIHEL